MFIIFYPIGWVESKLSSHKARYLITVRSKQGDADDMYVTDDYTRKWSGQIVFNDCETANQITISPSSYKIEVAKVRDTSSAKTCKVE